jgi:hypothetical protein
MRLVSILVVLVIGISLFSTGSAFRSLGTCGTVSLQMLDICHTAAPVMNPDLPFISAYPCTPLPPQVAGFFEPHQTQFNPFISTFQDERPPNPTV